MATDKRFTYPREESLSKGGQIRSHSPTTSANQDDQSSQQDHLRVNGCVSDSNNNILLHSVSSNPNSSYVNFGGRDSLTSYSCHSKTIERSSSSRYNSSATRSLLFDSSQSNSTTSSSLTATSDSDEAPTPPPNYHDIPGIVPSYQGRTSGPPPSYDEVVNPNASPPSYQSLFGQVREARKTSNGLVDLFRQLFLILIGTLGCTMIIGFLLLIPITMILVGLVYINECRAENIPTFLVVGGLVWIVKNVLNCYNQFKKDSTANRPPPRRAPITANRTNHQTSNALIISQSQMTASSGIQESAPNYISTTVTMSPQSQNSVTVPTTPSNDSPTIPRTTRVSSIRDTQASQNRNRHPSMIGLTSYKCESMLNYFLMVWFLAGCMVVYRIYEPDYDNPLSLNYCHRNVYMYAFWLMTSAFITMAIILSCLCCLMASSVMSCHQGR